MMTRRHALKTTVLASAALATLPGAIAQESMPKIDRALISTTAGTPFTLPPLPYAYDALEPFIDAQTMQIHHDKHHAAYVANLNKAFEPLLGDGPPATLEGTLKPLLQNLHSVPENIRTAVRNNGGGHYNHSLFWQMMKKNGGGTPTGELAKAIDASFGSFSAFKDALTKAAIGQFGSGWAWLVLGADKKLTIMATANQDTPISLGLGEPVGFKNATDQMKMGFANHFHHTPLLGIDVWEHAYYLKYQNKRADYIGAWFNVVNWDFVAGRYAQASA